MKRFRLKLPHGGSPWIEVEAYDVDGALDAGARKYGWADYAEMVEKHGKEAGWGEDDGFTVELIRGQDDGTPKS